MSFLPGKGLQLRLRLSLALDRYPSSMGWAEFDPRLDRITRT